jgi:hypothetical protein
VPAAVGTPEIIPAVLIVKPAGSALPAATVQAKGGVPPVAFRVTGAYAVPTVPPASGEALVMLNAVPAGLTVIEKAFVAVPAAASVTVMLVLTVPAAVGTPEIIPAVLSVKPAGRALPDATVQAKGGVPPVAFRVTGAYAVPTVPAASGEALVMLNAVPVGLTVIEKAFVTVPDAASVTLMLVLTVPAAVGTPEIIPAVLSVKPAGRALPAATVQAYGAVPPLTANDWLYAVPTVPEGSGEAEVMVMGEKQPQIERCVILNVALPPLTATPACSSTQLVPLKL